MSGSEGMKPQAVALRKESVDRNSIKDLGDIFLLWSLSARRAWIEITVCATTPTARMSLSARRAWIEIHTSRSPRSGTVSLSARRAWIEITIEYNKVNPRCVALRKESVDRNCSLGAYPADGSGSLSARRAWIEIYRPC